MILYGRNPVREALRGRRRVLRAWAAADLDWLRWRRGRAVEAPQCWRSSAARRSTRASARRPSRIPTRTPTTLLATDDALVVCLDQVQDPHNLGAVCRVAEAAGAAGVVIPERRAAEVTPAVCKASAGAVEHLPVARVRNVADWLAAAKEAGAWVYGASADADIGYDQPDWSGRAVLVLGVGGAGPPAAGRGGLRRARLAADGRPGRLAERVHRRGRARSTACGCSGLGAILQVVRALDRAP